MINLAVMTELPLVIIDVQRAGPSTGMPTKTEQGDLLQALWGRNGESPVPVIAAQSPADCFDAAIEASRIAVTRRTPVVLLSDAYLANGSEPHADPADHRSAAHRPRFREDPDDGEVFEPYRRDPLTLNRPWAIPGTPGLSTGWAGWRSRTGSATSATTPRTTTRWCG